jgi:hypothetical protein
MLMNGLPEEKQRWNRGKRKQVENIYWNKYNRRVNVKRKYTVGRFLPEDSECITEQRRRSPHRYFPRLGELPIEPRIVADEQRRLAFRRDITHCFRHAAKSFRILILRGFVEDDHATVSPGGKGESQTLAFRLRKFQRVGVEHSIQAEDAGERARRMSPFIR